MGRGDRTDGPLGVEPRTPSLIVHSWGIYSLSLKTPFHPLIPPQSSLLTSFSCPAKWIGISKDIVFSFGIHSCKSHSRKYNYWTRKEVIISNQVLNKFSPYILYHLKEKVSKYIKFLSPLKNFFFLFDFCETFSNLWITWRLANISI